MKKIHSQFLYAVLLVCGQLITVVHAGSMRIIEETDYAQENIGNTYIFNEDMVYIDLTGASENKIKNNGGLKLALTRAWIADVAKKNNPDQKIIAIPSSMTFKLVRILREVHDLNKWDNKAKEMYLSYSGNNPDIDMLFVLEDTDGKRSTAMSGTFRRALSSADTNN